MSKLMIFFLCILCFNCSIKQSYLNQLYFNKDVNIESSNLYKINRMFRQMNRQAKSKEDYYFIVIGDTRNLIRSYDLNPFNQVVKHIFFLKDKTTGEPIYNKVKFMVHLGDFVYNGAERTQWLNLKRAFSEKDYAEKSYAYLKTFTASKPIFPVLGNHDIMKFDLRIPSSGKGFDKSKKGVKYFKEFFNWNGFISNSFIITPIPAEFDQKTFKTLLKRLSGEKNREKLIKHYVLMPDKHYHLKIFQDIIKEFKDKNKIQDQLKENFLDPGKKKEVISDLQGVFTTLGYNTVPVIGPDNMICYAFEIGDLVFLVLDSMARGFHYKNFEKLKRALLGKNNQHRLHLFSKSDLNGQYEFFKAVFNYAGRQGKTLVPMWHHSPLNGHTIINGLGVGFNIKLMLGLKPRKENNTDDFDKNGDQSFLDDIIFSSGDGSDSKPGINHVFTSCVHSFEKFLLNSKNNQKDINQIKWFITGGGGAELSKKFNFARLKQSIKLYNQRLAASDFPGRQIKITGHQVTRRYHFLVVQVKEGKIVDVYPYFVEKEQVNVRPSPFFRNLRFKSLAFSSPVSIGSIMGVDLVKLGFEKASRYLYFITWEPGLELGLLSGDIAGDSRTTGILSFSPGKFSFNVPRHRYTFTLLGYTKIFGTPGAGKEYISFGVESPVLHNMFGAAKRWSLAFNWYIPLNRGESIDNDFGEDIKFSLGLCYKF